MDLSTDTDAMTGQSRGSLAARVTRAPVPYDPEAAREACEALDSTLRSGPVGDLIAGTGGSAPYLARLIARHADWLGEVATQAPEAATEAILDDLAAEAREADRAGLASLLRRAKSRAALLIALADLGGVWALGEVTRALTALADACVAVAVRWLLAEELRRGRLPGLGEADLETGAGYCVLAMGKQGAGELNYSSDIDLICLFDQDRFEPSDYADVKARFIKVTRALVGLLSDQTAEGYVFRTDLRLRPAPSTTPVCMAMEAAERYYESVGRTWERAAHIKARPVAGDLAAGQAYLERLTPFVWRRYLDFAAIEDTHAMLRKIREKKGRFSPGTLPGYDIKLGPGGIREIEFFAQTRQLIMGGREPRLRVPTTLGALEALVETGHLSRETAEGLGADYAAHRMLEHRLQMIDDAQTQVIPKSESVRARIAALSGSADRAAWEAEIAERLARVYATSEAFFGADAGETAEKGPAPEATPESLAEAGFRRTEDAARIIARWRDGEIPATRSRRAQRLFASLQPRILRKLARPRSPREAIAEFDRFLTGLPAGVQVFSLFKANPHLLELIVDICAMAPKLAGHLGREPQTLEALLGPEFFAPLPGKAALVRDLEAWLAESGDYEDALNTVRRWAREQRFRAGVQVLRAMADEAEAGAVFSAIAEACLAALLPRVIDEFARRHGPPPGNGLAIIAMGKLGSREMTAGSDLDLIIVYDAGEAEQSEGRRPLAPAAYYPRLTQSLLSALTAPTAEGRLYEVDMRLRPSGRQGPVAVSLSAFERYQAERAWVWEHLALTRARVVAGAEGPSAAVREAIRTALAARAGDAEIPAAAAEMRLKLVEAHRGERDNPWAFKHTTGGLMQIELALQTGVLYHGLQGARGGAAALPRLVEAGWLRADDAETLGRAMELMQRLQQIERVALDHPFDPERAGVALRKTLCQATGFADFTALQAGLRDAQTEAEAVVERLMKPDSN